MRSGETISLATGDAARVGLAARVIGWGGGSAAGVVSGSALLLATSWRLGAVVLAGLPVVAVLVRRLSAPLVARSDAEQAAAANATAVATDLVSGIRVLKGVGAERAAAARYRAASRSALTGRMRAARLAGVYDAATTAIGAAFSILVVWLGAVLAVAGSISIGELIAVVGLAQFLVGALGRLAGIGTGWAMVRASACRVDAFLAVPAAVTDGPDAGAPASSGVVLEHVRHGALAGTDLTVPARTWLGVVADPPMSAALVDLLARRCDPESGSLWLGDRRFPALTLDVLRTAVMVADHDASLFAGSVAESLGPDLPGGVDLEGLMRATALDDVIAALPHGTASAVGGGGTALSGGQRQRLCLARAVAGDPPVLVLHDPTTAVDAATEARVAAGVRALRAGRTTIVVTTSPAWLAACDRVLVLGGDGTVRAGGTHAELLSGDADYRTLVAA